MSGVIAGVGDARSHTLARHRDILTDLTQVGAGRWLFPGSCHVQWSLAAAGARQSQAPTQTSCLSTFHCRPGVYA